MSEENLTILQQRVLRQLYKGTGRPCTARALSLALGVSQPAISKALPGLEKRSLALVSKDKKTKRLAIQLNREDPLVIGLKRADNLKQVYESGLVQFLYDALPPGAAVILFGSYSHGEDTASSDIDLAIVGAKGKELGLTRFEKVLEREIIVNFYDSFSRIDKPLLGNILSGIVLKGAVELG